MNEKEETSEKFNYQELNSIAAEKKMPQQVCKKCRKEFNQGENVCPHCGNTNWIVYIGIGIIGLVFIPTAIFFILHSIDSDVIVMKKLDFFLSIVGGFIGVVLLYSGIVTIAKSLQIRKKNRLNSK